MTKSKKCIETSITSETSPDTSIAVMTAIKKTQDSLSTPPEEARGSTTDQTASVFVNFINLIYDYFIINQISFVCIKQ